VNGQNIHGHNTSGGFSVTTELLVNNHEIQPMLSYLTLCNCLSFIGFAEPVNFYFLLANRTASKETVKLYTTSRFIG